MLSDKIFKGTMLESLVGGNLLVLGLWYLNRPFLLQNFPNVAVDAAVVDPSAIGGKLVILTLSTVVAAIFLSHLVDVVIPVMTGGPLYVDKRHKFIKKAIVLGFRLFTFTVEPDPRVTSTRRYLASDRKSWFLMMIRDWCHSSENGLNHESEIVKAHQHITTRLKVLSDASRSSLAEAYSDVAFAGGIFVALILLLPAGILSLWLNSTVKIVETQHGLSVWVILFTIYVSAILSGFLFRRRLRTFYSQIITLGLHFYDEAKQGRAREA